MYEFLKFLIFLTILWSFVQLYSINKLIKNRHIFRLSPQTPQLFAALLPHLNRFPKNPNRLLHKLQHRNRQNRLPLNLQHQFLNHRKRTLHNPNLPHHKTILQKLMFNRMEIGLQMIQVLVDRVQEIHTEIQGDAGGLGLE